MSKSINLGKYTLGGGSRVLIQSMTNTKTCDYDATFRQIENLYENGCDIVRLAITNDEDIRMSKKFLEKTKAELVADIQFDYRLAIRASDIGFKKIRINPGNIGDESKIKELVSACKQNSTVIRVGSNSGSVEKEIYAKYGNSPEALAESVMRNVKVLEKYGFYDIVLSAKASNVSGMIEANRLLNELSDYPIHLGVTESGPKMRGIVKSSIGIGALLKEGIGDTIRVSLSCDPTEEVIAAKMILQSLGLDKNYCEIVSCPTCARCNYDLSGIVEWLDKYTSQIKRRLKIAVMGCAVNGPGEAKDADFGVAGGVDKAVIFKKGEIIKTVPFDAVRDELKSYIDGYDGV